MNRLRILLSPLPLVFAACFLNEEDIEATDCPPDDPDCEESIDPIDQGNDPHEPLDTTTQRTWLWTEIEGSTCIDGSPTGIGYYLNEDSDKLLVYLQEGGACFDVGNPLITCDLMLTRANYGSADFDAEIRVQGGVLADGENNPFADWNKVFIPYCSGDVHAGSKAEGFDGNVFTGAGNVARALARIAATTSPARAALVGSSAGAMGTFINYPQVVDALDGIRIDLVADSATPLEDATMQPCLQRLWREQWNLNAALPEGCTECTDQANGGGLVNLLPYLDAAYPDARFGILTATQDATMRLFFGSDETCSSISQLPDNDYADAIASLRSNVVDPLRGGDSPDNWAMHTQEGTDHVFLVDSDEAGYVLPDGIADWLSAMVNDDENWDHRDLEAEPEN